MNSTFKSKLVKFNESYVRILCQNENGPCPLLALANILILQGRITIPSEHLSANNLVQILAENVITVNEDECNRIDGSNIEEGVKADLKFRRNEQLVYVMEILPSLIRGLDVNVKFNDVDSFEYTQELSVFDAFNIRCYHGWVVDPGEYAADFEYGLKVHATLHKLSYNECINKLVSYDSYLLTSQANEAEEQLLSLYSDPSVSASNEPSSGNIPTTAAAVSSDLLDFGISNNNNNNNNNNTSIPANGHAAVDEGVSRPLHIHPQPLKPRQPPTASDTGGVQPEDSHTVTNGEVNSSSHANINGPASITTPAAAVTVQDRKEEHDIITHFMDTTASQLTYYGLIRLHQQIRDQSLSILFRNNHFNVIYKHQDKLYVLVTDEGFCVDISALNSNKNNSTSIGSDNNGASSDPLAQCQYDDMVIVWELIQDIHGDTEYVTSNFQMSSMNNNQTITTPHSIRSPAILSPAPTSSSHAITSFPTHTIQHTSNTSNNNNGYGQQPPPSYGNIDYSKILGTNIRPAPTAPVISEEETIISPFHTNTSAVNNAAVNTINNNGNGGSTGVDNTSSNAPAASSHLPPGVGNQEDLDADYLLALELSQQEANYNANYVSSDYQQLAKASTNPQGILPMNNYPTQPQHYQQQQQYQQQAPHHPQPQHGMAGGGGNTVHPAPRIRHGGYIIPATPEQSTYATPHHPSQQPPPQYHQQQYQQQRQQHANMNANHEIDPDLLLALSIANQESQQAQGQGHQDYYQGQSAQGYQGQLQPQGQSQSQGVYPAPSGYQGYQGSRSGSHTQTRHPMPVTGSRGEASRSRDKKGCIVS